MENKNLPKCKPPPPPPPLRKGLTKPDTTLPCEGWYDKEESSTIFLELIIVFILTLAIVLVSFKIYDQHQKIEAIEADYQILLKACNEKG